MKTLRIAAILALVATLALGATQFTNILNLKVSGKTLLGTTTETGNVITKVLGTSATVDFTSTSVGRAESSSITLTGAQVGDACSVGTTAAGGALAAQYTCYVSAANTVKIVFTPQSRQRGTQALTSGSPSTAVIGGITASSTCTCNPVGATAAIAAAGCAVGLADPGDGGYALTLTGPNTVTTTMVYDCVAPVDPASGTFYVRVVSAQ